MEYQCTFVVLWNQMPLRAFPTMSLCHSRSFLWDKKDFLAYAVNFMMSCRYLVHRAHIPYASLLYHVLFRSPKNNSVKSHQKDRHLEEFWDEAHGKQIKKKNNIPAHCGKGKLNVFATIKYYILQMYPSYASLINYLNFSFLENGKEITNIYPHNTHTYTINTQHTYTAYTHNTHIHSIHTHKRIKN